MGFPGWVDVPLLLLAGRLYPLCTRALITAQNHSTDRFCNLNFMASTPTVSLASTMAFTDALNSGANRLKSIFSRSSKKLHPSRIISEENLARYCPGGYHPVRIGDLFNNGKYKIVSKLGYGVYSTVWLACNLE